MGCDGGTIPKRNELVRQKEKPKQKDKEAETSNLWSYCFLSQELLREPIVVCALGHLYNKTAIIEKLLNKNGEISEKGHIKGLRDVREVKLIQNPEHSSAEKLVIGRNTPLYICPITKLEMNGRHRFVALWNCGCVFSEKTLKEIDDNFCPSCSKAYKHEETIILNGNAEDIEKMKRNLQTRKLSKCAKKRRKI